MKIKIIHILNHVNTDSLLISFWNTVIEKIQAWKRQTRAWVTCAKPSRQNKNPGVSYTFIRSLLKQHYPKYINDVVSKILKEKKHNNQIFCLNLGFSWNWVSCGKSWKSLLLPILVMFHRTDYGGFLVSC